MRPGSAGHGGGQVRGRRTRVPWTVCLAAIVGFGAVTFSGQRPSIQDAYQDAYAQVVYCETWENEAVEAVDSSWIEMKLTLTLATEEGIGQMRGHDELRRALYDARRGNRAAVARLTGLLEREGLIKFGMIETFDPERCDSHEPGGAALELLGGSKGGGDANPHLPADSAVARRS